jgi:hypothetical protein
MPDDDDGNVFSADINGVKLGGLNLGHIGTVATSIYQDLSNEITKYPHLGGDGSDDISKSLKLNYEEPAKDCLSFVRDLSELIENHGGKTFQLGDLFDDMNTNSTDQAGGVPGHRR